MRGLSAAPSPQFVRRLSVPSGTRWCATSASSARASSGEVVGWTRTSPTSCRFPLKAVIELISYGGDRQRPSRPCARALAPDSPNAAIG